MKQNTRGVKQEMPFTLRPHLGAYLDGEGRAWVTQADAARRQGVTVQGISRATREGRLARVSYLGRWYIPAAALDQYAPVSRTSPGPRPPRRRPPQRRAAVGVIG